MELSIHLQMLRSALIGLIASLLCILSRALRFSPSRLALAPLARGSALAAPQQCRDCCTRLCAAKGTGVDPKSGKTCAACKGTGGVNCLPCKGKGVDRVNGSVLERWTCKRCKGFGYVPCANCNAASRGLTPEQTGER